MALNIWRVKDYAGLLINQIDNNKDDLPEPLRWIEPSINNLYLESVSSFLLGNYFSSIVTASILLEHCLRLAVVNKDDCGLKRTESISKIDSYSSLANVIDAAIHDAAVFSGCNEQWWRDVAKFIRNKSAHYLLPKIMTDCIEQASFYGYFRQETVDSKKVDPENYKIFLSDWGSFYHKDDRHFAKKFLADVYEELTIVIDNTNWVGDESWWISQKENYDLFFSFNWSFENTTKSMINSRRPFNLESVD